MAAAKAAAKPGAAGAKAKGKAKGRTATAKAGARTTVAKGVNAEATVEMAAEVKVEVKAEVGAVAKAAARAAAPPGGLTYTWRPAATSAVAATEAEAPQRALKRLRGGGGDEASGALLRSGTSRYFAPVGSGGGGVR